MMDCQEELRTAYANLKGHQDRSASYIRTIDQQQEEINRLKSQLERLADVKEIARYIVLRLEKEETEGHGAGRSADAEKTGCRYDGYLNVEELMQWVLGKVANG